MKIRIKQARESAKLTQAGLAKAIGVSRGAVSLWESLRATELPTLENLGKIAHACDVSVGWLVSSEGDNFSQGPDNRGLVPVISWVQAGLTTEPMDLHEPGSADNYIPCPVSHGPHTYALRVIGRSMTSDNPLEKSYPEGCLIYCDPDQRGCVPTGSPVIAAMLETGEVTFKILVIDRGKRWLQPLNISYDRIIVPFEIRSVVIGSFHY